jgi:hypothetical protein
MHRKGIGCEGMQWIRLDRDCCLYANELSFTVKGGEFFLCVAEQLLKNKYDP